MIRHKYVELKEYVATIICQRWYVTKIDSYHFFNRIIRVESGIKTQYKFEVIELHRETNKITKRLYSTYDERFLSKDFVIMPEGFEPEWMNSAEFGPSIVGKKKSDNPKKTFSKKGSTREERERHRKEIEDYNRQRYLERKSRLEKSNQGNSK
mgnify:CR=1 FL=1